MSSSGKGQSVVNAPEEVAAAWDHAMIGGRVTLGQVIVEEMIEFDFEITLLTVRAVGDSGEVETFFCEPIGHVQVKGDYVESWQPQYMDPAALAKARTIATKATTRLGGRGIFGVELFVKGARVWFSEVSPRPHDTGMVTIASQEFNEFELHARAILGLPVSAARRRRSRSRAWMRRCGCAGSTSGCSASRNRSPGGAWAWCWPKGPTSRRRGPARRRPPPKFGQRAAGARRERPCVRKRHEDRAHHHR